MVFVDLTKVLDKVSRDSLNIILSKLGCPEKLLHIIKSVHDDMKVSLTGADSGYFLTVANEKTGGFPRKSGRDHALCFCYKRNQRPYHT